MYIYNKKETDMPQYWNTLCPLNRCKTTVVKQCINTNIDIYGQIFHSVFLNMKY